MFKRRSILVFCLLAGHVMAQGPGAPAEALDARGIDELMRRTDGAARISLHGATGAVRFLGLPPGKIPLRGRTPLARATAFLRDHGQVFGITDPVTELTDLRVETDRYGFRHWTLRQVYRGLPVFAGTLKLHTDAQGRLTAVNGTFVPRIDLDPTPRRAAAEAAATALAFVRAEFELPATTRLEPVATRLLVFRSGLVRRIPGRNHLAYEVEVRGGSAVREFVYVDAHDGKVVEHFTGIHDALERTIHEPDFNAAVIWDEGDALPYSTGNTNNDDQVNGLIDFAADVYDLYTNLSGGNHLSWDGSDGVMHSVWKPSFLGCPNASWNGTSANFCDGVASDDVVSHEWTHAYTQATHGLIYRWQPGALNEAYSDIFGEVIDFINGAGTDAPAPLRSVGDCSTFGGSPPPGLQIHGPRAVAGFYAASGSSFNPPPPVSVTANVERVNDGNQSGNGSVTDACEPLIGFTPGRIALIDRGACSFVTKVNAAENAGAVGVIIVNNQSGLFEMSGNDPGNTTPVVLIDIDDGAALKAQLDQAQVVGATLTLNGAGAASYRWLVGEDSSGFGGAIRDLWNPVCFSDPGKVSDVQYFCGAGDNGGVHSNSGVPNHLFALTVDGGSYNGQTISGLGLTKAAHLYWRAMSVYQVQDSGFADHADALGQSCADLVGAPLTDLATGLPTTKLITSADCAEVAQAALATEMHQEPDCDFQPLLAQDPPALSCPSVAFADDFESAPTATWTRTNGGVYPEYLPRDWELTTDLPPGGGSGSAFFAVDDIQLGNCVANDDDQSGTMSLDSPLIALAGSDPTLRFDHYVATEGNYDGGNLKVSVNGAPFQVVPGSSFLFNPYNTILESGANTNPLAGEEAFSGSDGGQVSGSWGQSQVDLSALAAPGDTLRLRFEFGVDGCNGLDGWYLDDVVLCTAAFPAGHVPDGDLVPGAPLLVNKGAGGDLTLSWSDSCIDSDTDYAVYEGPVGDFTSHAALLCSTGGATTADVTPLADQAYYLVVPRNAAREGSYGLDGDGLERAPAAAACRVQEIVPSCP